MLAKEEEHITNVSYDSVIFGFNGKQLKILVLEYHNTGMFALPGGFVKKKESLDDAAKRGVRERTGLDKIHLEQFYTFGAPDRIDTEPVYNIARGLGEKINKNHWLLDRFISVGYYALLDYNKVKLTPDQFCDSINWYAIDELPKLMMDHKQIVEKALEALRGNLERKLSSMNLLPEKFTMKELQTVYEVILDKELRRTTFQRKMLGLGILKRHEKLFTGAANKAPYLYSFDKNLVQTE